MQRLTQVLRISQGESRVASRLLLLMFVAWFGFAIGGNSVEGLLFTQVGPETLPYLFVALGVTTAGVMLGMNKVLARPRPQRLLLLTLPGMVAAVLAMRGLLALDETWVYPTTWLALMVLWTGAGIVTWGIAGALHDARQVKRLFPLYSSGVILGGAVGGVVTGPLARWLAVENLMFIWAGALAVSFGLARSALRVAGTPVASPRAHSRPAGIVPAPGRKGIRSVRRPPLIVWMSVSIALFAMLYFSLTLVFAREATERFRDADSLAGFFGMFMGATSGTALLVSLLGANRLSARVGVAALILVMPMIYLGGFAVLVASTAFLPLLGFRFVQMVWMGGVWAGAWQALYNVLPPEHRDGTRAFVDGVALQAGVVSAGVVLILADSVLEPGVVSVTWLVIAGVATATAMQLRRAYVKAVVDALRVGNPDVFLVEEKPFGGYRRDATALSVVTRAATDPDPAVRRVAVEILAEMRHSDGEVFLRALADKDPTVRCAGLRGIRRLGSDVVTNGPGAKLVSGLLGDGDAAVRLAAVEVLSEMNGRAAAALSPLLKDPDPRVRARASGRLLGRDPGAVEALRAMARSEDAEWRAEAIREWGRIDNGIAAATSALSDPDPLVRSAAVSALAGHDADAAVSALVTALGDRDSSIRSQAVASLVRTGPASVRPLLDARPSPELEAGAMKALVLLDAVEHSVVAGYLDRKVSLASRYAAFLGVLRDDDDPRVELVAHALRHAARLHAVDALEVAGRSWDDQAAEAIALAIENLEVRDPAQRAIALETLEAVGQSQVIRPLLAAWEERISVSGDRMTVLAELMRDPEPWVRACAAFAGAQHAQLRPYAQRLAHADPDTIVREAAVAAHGGEASTETLSNLSLMERIMFLRRVPLFVNLTPTDIKQVAEVATEHAFAHGALISEQGDLGEEMHVVLLGDIRVLVDRGGEPPIEVARRVTGEYVGEMAVVSRAPRMASLVAEGEVRTLAIDRRRFERILRERPEASLAVMSVLCERLRELHQDAPEVLS